MIYQFLTLLHDAGPVYQLLALLVMHWIADFCFQTHWQASNKSKNSIALAEHVLTYTMVLAAVAPSVFFQANLRTAMFVLVNGVLHFATDWCTSRVTSRLFMAQFDVTLRSATMRENFTLHNFFVVVGLDQLIHHVTLGLTMVYFFGAR